MADRELLELAAKAAGYEYEWEWPRGAKEPTFFRVKKGSAMIAWRPIDDDGDALRLAVKLGIHVIPGEEGDPYAVATWWVRPERIKQDFERVLVDVDRAAAVRQAIVRAAAEIGKAMP